MRSRLTPILLALLVAVAACAPSAPRPVAASTPAVAPKPTAVAASPTAAKPSTSGGQACPTDGVTTLTGAGATFPALLYTRWFDEYKTLCNVSINYQAIGSGGGIRQHTEKTAGCGAIA